MVVFLHRFADISILLLTSSRTSSSPTGRRWRRWSSSCTATVCRYFKLVTYFLKDFLHPDREKVEEMVVFIHRYADYFNLVTDLFKDFVHSDREKVEEMVVFLHSYSMQIFQTGHLLPQGLPPSRQGEGGGDGRLYTQVCRLFQNGR